MGDLGHNFSRMKRLCVNCGMNDWELQEELYRRRQPRTCSQVKADKARLKEFLERDDILMYSWI